MQRLVFAAFHNGLSISEYTASNDMVMEKQLLGKSLKGNSHCVIDILH
jgi:hypothetical protein